MFTRISALRSAAALVAVLLFLSATSALTLPQSPSPAQDADRDEAAAAPRGTLILNGRIYRSPFRLEETGSDVLLEGRSVGRELAQRRVEQAVPADNVPRKYRLRHAAIQRIDTAYRSVLASGGESAALSRSRVVAVGILSIATAVIQGRSLRITWDDGDEEELLLRASAPATESSTESWFRRDFKKHLALLNEGGFVALGTNYIVTGSSREEEALLQSVELAVSRRQSVAVAEARLERETGSRAFAVDLVRINGAR